jgi:hypothetical protein
MNAVFKRKAEPVPSWKDADAYARMGYAVIQVEKWRVDDSHETPIVGMGYGSAIFSVGSEIRERDYNDEVGIISQKLPHAGISNDWAMSTWMSVLRLDIRTDRKLVRDIETLIEPRLSWRADVATRYAPVRLALDSSAILMPFRLDTGGYTSPSGKTRGFQLPKDGRWDMPNVVSISTAYECFVASRFPWRDGLDLRAVHIDALPLMNRDTAAAILSDVEALLDARGVEAR